MKPTSTPVVTIAIPTYNSARYLEETIDAVMRQTFTDWELVIVDDASTDGTASILGKLPSILHDPRVRVFHNDHNLRMVGNWNAAVSRSRGRFLKLLCADDILVPDCIDRQVRALDAHPSAVVASGARVIINSRGKRLFVRNGIGRTGLYPGRAMIRRSIMSGTNIIGDPVNVMWRRSAMEEVGIFDPSVVYCTDVEYWMRLLSVGDLYYDAEPVGFYRIHAEAAATGLAGVTVRDFLHTARLQEARGSVSLSPFDLRIIATKSRFKSLLRQMIYRLLG